MWSGNPDINNIEPHYGGREMKKLLKQFEKEVKSITGRLDAMEIAKKINSSEVKNKEEFNEEGLIFNGVYKTPAFTKVFYETEDSPFMAVLEFITYKGKVINAYWVDDPYEARIFPYLNSIWISVLDQKNQIWTEYIKYFGKDETVKSFF